MKLKVLLLDPDRTAGRSLEVLLPERALTTICSRAEGLRAVAEGEWDLVLLDVEFCGTDLELLPRILEEKVGAVVVTARRPSLSLTLDAIQRGALDVLAKPFDQARIRELVEPFRSAPRLHPLPESRPDEGELIGSSPEMLAVFRTVARAAASDATVLLLGESGTGKELVAETLHHRSPRAGGPFVAINCAAIPENLLESELFGHEKGAFTGAIGRRIGRLERARGGTLFLDEIGDMSLTLQAKILRALQERRIERVGGSGTVALDVRLVAATNQDLTRSVAEGRFREDLFYRLAVVTLRLPPLRDRGDDLDRLAEHFAALYAHEHGRPVRALAEETLGALRAHPWPGNVRQLRNALERAVVMCEGEVLLPRHLPMDVLRPEQDSTPRAAAADSPLGTLAEMERQMIRRALVESGRNLSLAAERLGIHRNTLRRKISEYGLGGERATPAG